MNFNKHSSHEDYLQIPESKPQFISKPSQHYQKLYHHRSQNFGHQPESVNRNYQHMGKSSFLSSQFQSPQNYSNSNFSPVHNYSQFCNISNKNSLSPHFQNKSQNNTVKSMMFLPNNKIVPASANTSKPTGKLDMMARIATKNFDDSEQIGMNKNASQQEQNKLGFKNFEHQKISPTKQHLNVPQNKKLLYSNYSDQQPQTHKSFIYSKNSSDKKVPNLDFLSKFKKQQEQKKKKSQININEQKFYEYGLDHNLHKPLHRMSEQTPHHINSHNNQSTYGNFHKHQLHNKLYHQHSAPVIHKHQPLLNFQPKKLNFQSRNDHENKFDLSKNAHIQKNLHKQKLGLDNPKVHIPTSSSPGINQHNKHNFTKKRQQSMTTTQENTPVKEKLIVAPSFFKNRNNKNPQFLTNNKKDYSPHIKTIYQAKQPHSNQIKATFSDSGSGQDQSIQYKSNDKVIQTKQWDLDDFQLGDKLGKGAFGDVYVARQKTLGFMCVLKKMSKKRIKQQQRQQHVIRQLKIQLYLNHRHLTALYGYFHDKENIWLVMEYLPDGNLSQIKRRKKTSQKQTAQILKQVCQGLNFMHKRNIIHRDIKPENIFFNEGYIKLGDFGCSVFTDSLRRTVVSCLEYSSPEQLNNGYYNEKIDVWGVGVLAFQLLTGKSPFGDKMQNMMQGGLDVNFSDIHFPKDVDISGQAVDFIKSLLNIDPIQRLDIQEALQHKFITENTKDFHNHAKLH